MLHLFLELGVAYLTAENMYCKIRGVASCFSNSCLIHVHVLKHPKKDLKIVI